MQRRNIGPLPTVWAFSVKHEENNHDARKKEKQNSNKNDLVKRKKQFQQNKIVKRGKEKKTTVPYCRKIRTLSKYLTPTTTESHIEDDDYTKYSIEDERLRDIVETIILNKNVLSMELMLLVVNSIRTGGKKIMKALFKKIKSAGAVNVGDVVIF